MIESLDVMLWGRKAGTLAAVGYGRNKRICFYFDPDFVRSGSDIAPLRAPLGGVVAQNGLPVYPEEDKAFGGLPSFIADSLPDHWGNRVFNEWAVQRNIRQRDLSALDRLAYIGERGMGALEFKPSAIEELNTPFRVEISQLSELAQSALHDARGFHNRLSGEVAIESLFRVGTSAGGRRPKAVINLNHTTGECYSGQVAAPEPGFTPMIIKFDEHSSMPTTRIEFSYWLMSRWAGLNMTPARLYEAGKEAHFLTERFDRREGGHKIHIQTLAAMNPAASSYEELFNTARRLGLLPGELQQLFLQMALNVVAANADDHNKNFSFLMDTDGVWHPAPAYDFTFSVDLSMPHYMNRHCMSINGAVEEISKEDLLAVASRFEIKGAASLINRAIEAASRYETFALEAGVPAEWVKRIQGELRSRINALETR